MLLKIHFSSFINDTKLIDQFNHINTIFRDDKNEGNSLAFASIEISLTLQWTTFPD
jgi:hypothetical protein